MDSPALAALVLQETKDSGSDDTEHENIAEKEAGKATSEINKTAEEVDDEVENFGDKLEGKLCCLLDESTGGGEEGPDELDNGGKDVSDSLDDGGHVEPCLPVY